MAHLDLVRTIALVTAFASAASKLLPQTLSLWSRFPSWAQRTLPGLVLTLGALPSTLAGAKTWSDFFGAVLMAIALGLPGRHALQGTDSGPPTTRPTPTPTPPPLALLAFFALALALIGCGPSPRENPGATATPLEASGVLLARQVATDVGYQTGEWAGYDYFPVCCAVAVSPNEVLTAAHCLEKWPLWFVDYRTFEVTTSGKIGLAEGTVDGNIQTLIPAQPLGAWLESRAPAIDGEAEISTLVGTHLQNLATKLSGGRFDAQLWHGASGSPISQDGALVGIVETCTAPNPDNGTTCLPGGAFDPVVLP